MSLPILLLIAILPLIVGWLTNLLPGIEQADQKVPTIIKLMISITIIVVAVGFLSDSYSNGSQQIDWLSCLLIFALLLQVVWDVIYLISGHHQPWLAALLIALALAGLVVTIYMLYPPTSISQTLDAEVRSEIIELENLLKEKQWEQADLKTTQIIVKVAEVSDTKLLEDLDWDIFPCNELIAVDKLWLQQSNERFGFSMQKYIFEEEAGGDPNRFTELVGWNRDSRWREKVSGGGYYYSIKAPDGHLPVNYLSLDVRLFGVIDGFNSRLGQCNARAERPTPIQNED